MRDRLLGSATCLSHLDGGIQFQAFPRTQEVNLPAFSPYHPFCTERKAGKLLILFFTSLGMISQGN